MGPDAKIVHVYVRKIPAVSAGIEKAFNSLESKAFVETAACARRGHVDIAKSINAVVCPWWIVEEWPLDSPESRRKSNEKGIVTLR